MKKLYTKKTFANTISLQLLVFAVLLLSTIFEGYSQVRVPFAPRTSTNTPVQTVYNVKGDFTMIGNTNLTLVNYSNNGGNNADMRYVDVDSDLNTWNSSSSTLNFSKENNAIPECSNIIYAGLYWTGRAGSDLTFSVTKDGVTKEFDKRKISIKGPASGAYTEFSANANDIYYPSNTDGDMYSAYTEITQYVQQNGIGEYFVADIATIEGNGGSIGYYGGWGMVVVYENSKMNYRDVTVFDGHAFVQGFTTTNFTFDVNGFNTVQNGDVNVKIGLMAGEGDVGVSGDYFEIEQRNSGVFQRLSHAGNTTSNFFNSSIVTGGNTRNPNLQNNTGVDIAMFDLNNAGNVLIDNNQTSTRFRYGSTQDTYIIFNVTFSVDAYIPAVDGILTTTSTSATPPLSPNDSANYAVEIRNKGTEASNNTVITIPVPDNVNPFDLNVTSNVYAPFSTTNIPFYNPSIGSNGAIVWDLGTLPLPSDPNTVLADISFTLTVTTDCSILGSPSFDPNISLNGTISGIGAISNISFSNILLQGYQTSGLCIGEPIPAPSLIAIDYLNYINQPPTASNPAPINVECIDDVPLPDITVVTDEADNSGFPPVVAFVSDTPLSPDACGGIITRTYSVTDDCGNTINVSQTITVSDTIAPIAPIAPTNETYECLTDVPSPSDLTATDNCTGDITVAGVDIIDYANPCNVVITRTWTFTDSCNNTSSVSQTITVIPATVPVVPANAGSTVECLADATQPAAPVVADACGNAITPVITESADPACEGDKIYTFTYTDCAGNLSVYTYTYTIDLTPFILPANGLETVDNLADAVEPTPPTVTDNCGNILTPVLSDVSNTPDCQGSVVYTFTYTDCAGNAADWTYTYTIELAPFTVPANDGSTVECIADAVVPTPPTVLDANGNEVVPVMAENADPICEGDKIYTFTYTDCAGNTADWVYTYTIDLTTAPVVPANAGSTVECLADATQPAAPVVADACGNAITPVITESADPACEGDKIYTFTYTDCAGNLSVYTYTYTIDLTPFILPANGLETVDNLADAVEPTPPTVTDNCGNILTPVLSDVSNTPDCQGSVVYTFTYTDCAGNAADWTYTYTIELAPFTVPANDGSTVECIADAVVPTPPTVLDANGNEVVPVMAENADPICEGDKIYTFTYTDCAGNTADWVYTYTINDDVAPIAPAAPANIAFECLDDVPVAGNLTAVDNCSGNITVAGIDDIDQSNPCNVIITRTWTFTDNCGNSSSIAQVITVTDTTAPVAPNAPANMTYECIDDVPVAGNLTAVDNCTGNITVGGIDNIDNTNPCNVIITRTWTFTDDCGNTSSSTQTITVTDTTAPVLISDLDTEVSVSCANVHDAPNLNFEDNCTSNVNIVFDETNTFDETILTDYQIIRTWTVSDACGNENKYTQTLEVSLDEVVTEIVADDKCFDDGVVDLNQYLQTANLTGVWEMVEGNTQAILEGNIFNPTVLELSLDFKPGSGGIDYVFKYTTTDEGCINVTYVSMNINAECTVLPCGSEDVVISKAITPNGDQWNETFEISGVELCGFIMEIKVFNRWGALVYESNNYQNNWNGKSASGSIGNAGTLPNGTYYYIVILKDSGLPPFTGPVYLGTK